MNSRNTDYEFVSTGTDEIVSDLVAAYEKITGSTVYPASPEKLFIQWVADVLIQERIWLNYAGNQNIPSRASGENLDSLGELFFGTQRPQAQPAVCTVRFHISAAQETAILVPAGTRVTDKGGELTWQTVRDDYIPIGSTYVDIQVKCLTAGTVGNGYSAGQLNTLVDIYDYYSKCENTTTSDYGADAATDEEYFDLMRNSMDGYSTAGARGAYVYIAKQVSTEIADVLANCPAPGQVAIFAIMSDGSIAGEEIKTAVATACSAESVRPLTDHVTVKDAEQVRFNISFTYFVPRGTGKSAKDIENDVNAAVQNYIQWQSTKLGRDIVPDKLRELLYATGIKRVEMKEPAYTPLRGGMDNTVPQVACIGEIAVKNGGYEDE